MILIADGGATSTDWRLTDGESAITYTGIGINPYHSSEEQIVKELKSNKLSEHIQNISQVHFYGAGLANEKISGIIHRAFKRTFGELPDINVSDDLVGASRALFNNGSGIACILGTGSNSCLFLEGKIKDRIPPLGYILGDEGSGANIGIRLVNSLFKRELSAELSEVLLDEEGLSLENIQENVYKKQLPSRYLASLTKVVHKYLSHREIRDLVADAFQSFINKNIKRYRNYSEFEIGFVGSIAYYFKDVLIEVMDTCNLKPDIIIQSPIDRLVEYHIKNK